MLHPFHLAFPVRDLDEARAFYGGVLGCPEGRSSEAWIDFDFFGHQIVAHLSRGGPGGRSDARRREVPPEEQGGAGAEATNEVDGHGVPVRHFGVVLTWEEFPRVAERLRARGVKFTIEPYLRFKGQAGEQMTMFLADPSGNAIEFKAFKEPRRLFER